MAKRLDGSWHGGRPQPRPHCVRWRPSFSKKGHNPQFSTHVCCGQTDEWIKMSLGTEIRLGPGDIVLDGDPAPAEKRGGIAAAQFSAHALWPNSCMDQDATWYGGGPRLSDLVLAREPRSLPKRGTSSQCSANVCCSQADGWIKMYDTLC